MCGIRVKLKGGVPTQCAPAPGFHPQGHRTQAQRRLTPSKGALPEPLCSARGWSRRPRGAGTERNKPEFPVLSHPPSSCPAEALGGAPWGPACVGRCSWKVLSDQGRHEERKLLPLLRPLVPHHRVSLVPTLRSPYLPSPRNLGDFGLPSCSVLGPALGCASKFCFVNPGP